MALVFINFLNLNASQKRLGEKEATNSLVSSTKLNLVQKNSKKIFTIAVYRSNGKLSTKSECNSFLFGNKCYRNYIKILIQ